MDWFRFYTDTVYDRKIRRLTYAQRWLWVAVLTVARQSPDPGKLLLSERNVTETLHITDGVTVVVTNDDLADIAKVDLDDVDAGMKVFEKQNMIHIEDGVYVVTHWKKRQYISDSSAERVRRHRDKKQPSNVTETLQATKRNVTVTPPETDTDTELKDRKKIYALLAEQFPHGMSSKAQEDIFNFMDKGLQLELLRVAFKISEQQKPKDRPSYVAGILRGFLNDRITTLEQYEIHESQRQTAAGGIEREYSVHRESREPTGRETSQTSADYIQQLIDQQGDDDELLRVPEVPG